MLGLKEKIDLQEMLIPFIEAKNQAVKSKNCLTLKILLRLLILNVNWQQGIDSLRLWKSIKLNINNLSLNIYKHYKSGKQSENNLTWLDQLGNQLEARFKAEDQALTLKARHDIQQLVRLPTSITMSLEADI